MAIFGNNTDGGGVFPSDLNRALTTRFQCPSAGTLTQMSVIFDSSSTGTTPIKLFIAADNAGVPGSIIAVSGEVTVTPGGGTFSADISAALLAGTYYHLGWVSGGYNIYISRGTAEGAFVTRMANGNFSFASPPATWPTDSGYTWQQDIWGTYTESGGGGGATLGFLPLGFDMW